MVPELGRVFQNRKYTGFVFLLILCSLLSKASPLSIQKNSFESESPGTITYSPHSELFNGLDKFQFTKVQYLKADILGETIFLKKDGITVYKWPLQYENEDPMDEYHIYFFTGPPMDLEKNEWLDSNLNQIMNELKHSKGPEYLKISFPPFFLNLPSSMHPNHRPCINEFKAIQQGQSLEVNSKLHAPFLFALIRNRDTKVMFSQYIDDPLTEGNVCPFQGYSVSSKSVSIQADDSTIVGASHQGEEVSPIYSPPSFLWNAVIQEIHYDPFIHDDTHLGFPYLRVFLRGKRHYTETLEIFSFEAKPHLETKRNRYVFFLFSSLFNRPLPKFDEFSFDSFSNLMQVMSARPLEQLCLQTPPYLMKIHPIHSEPYFECLHEQKGIPFSMIEWNETKAVSSPILDDDLYFMIHDRIYNTTIATGQLMKPSDPATCRLY